MTAAPVVALPALTRSRLDDLADELLRATSIIAYANLLYRLSGEQATVDYSGAVENTRRILREVVEIAVANALGFATTPQEPS